MATIANWPLFNGYYICLTVFAYLSYLALGHLVANAAQLSKRAVLFHFIGAALCWLGLAFGSALLLPHFGSAGWEYMFAFPNVIVALMSYFIFRLVMNVNTKVNFRPLASLSLGIYAIHPLWVVALSKLTITGFTFGPAMGIPLISILVFGLSAGTAFVMSQFKYLRAVVS